KIARWPALFERTSFQPLKAKEGRAATERNRPIDGRRVMISVRVATQHPRIGASRQQGCNCRQVVARHCPGERRHFEAIQFVQRLPGDETAHITTASSPGRVEQVSWR